MHWRFSDFPDFLNIVGVAAVAAREKETMGEKL